MREAVLFDLGNTLVEYYDSSRSAEVVRSAVWAVRERLQQDDGLHVTEAEMWHGFEEENHEAADFQVRPLEERLTRMFRLTAEQEALLPDLSRVFLRPIFALAKVYDDSLPTLAALRAAGIRTAVVSNSPWGSPAEPWREELSRLGLAPLLDAMVFCSEVGWRKPARPIFERALELLGARAEQCLFVGDDPRWDTLGAAAVGMPAVLIDRTGVVEASGPKVASLGELWEHLEAS